MGSPSRVLAKAESLGGRLGMASRVSFFGSSRVTIRVSLDKFNSVFWAFLCVVVLCVCAVVSCRVVFYGGFGRGKMLCKSGGEPYHQGLRG